MSKPVLFVSFRPLERAENLHAIYDAYPGEKAHICTHDPHYDQEVLSGKYDLMVIDEFPDISPGKCIMIWHAIQGGKHIGLDQPNPYYHESYAKLMTKIVTAGTGSIDMWHQCTGVPKEDILPLGMPRTDAYVGKQKGSGGTVLAECPKSYLFAPTFRWDYDTPFPKINWKYIDDHLKDGELFVVKNHPVFGSLCDGVTYKHILEVPSSEPSANYLYDCDVLITDYSSIMFDAYLLRKPIVLFEKDPGYAEQHGMYMQYPTDYALAYAGNEYELLSALRAASWHKYRPLCDFLFANVLTNACDGHSCERIIKLIDELNQNEN